MDDLLGGVTVLRTEVAVEQPAKEWANTLYLPADEAPGRVSAGTRTAELIPYFVWANRALNYQSAFAEPRTSKSKPGLMCHAAAVSRYSARGLRHYSLLAGKDRYKHSLSTGAEELNWWALERFDWRLELEATLRKVIRR